MESSRVIEATHQRALMLFPEAHTTWERLNDRKFTDAAANVCFCLFDMTSLLYLTHFGVKAGHQYSWWPHLVIWDWTTLLTSVNFRHTPSASLQKRWLPSLSWRQLGCFYKHSMGIKPVQWQEGTLKAIWIYIIQRTKLNAVKLPSVCPPAIKLAERPTQRLGMLYAQLHTVGQI